MGVGSLLPPLAAAGGLIGAEFVGSKLQEFHGTGPLTAGKEALFGWGIPAALLVGGHVLAKKSGALGNVGFGMEVGSAVHLLARVLGGRGGLDFNLGSY